MDSPPDPISPTGLPLIPPKVVPYLAALVVAAAGVAAYLPDGKVKQYVTLGSSIGGMLLGILSPGWRKVADPNGPILKALLVAAVAGALVLPGRVQAQPIFSQGPTLPLVEIRPGNRNPIDLAPGAGVQFGVTLPQLQREFLGKSWDLLDLNLMLFGSKVSSSSGDSFGALSAALSFCTLSSLVCLGGGHDVLDSTGALGGGGWFGLVALSFNVALGPYAPPTGIAQGAAGMVRGNTLYLGGP